MIISRNYQFVTMVFAKNISIETQFKWSFIAFSSTLARVGLKVIANSKTQLPHKQFQH